VDARDERGHDDVSSKQDVDGRDKPGHDDEKRPWYRHGNEPDGPMIRAA
jgi:hypothetical protein